MYRSLKVAFFVSIAVWIAFAMTNTATLVADGDGGTKMTLLHDCDPRIGASWNTATDATQCIRAEG